MTVIREVGSKVRIKDSLTEGYVGNSVIFISDEMAVFAGRESTIVSVGVYGDDERDLDISYTLECSDEAWYECMFEPLPKEYLTDGRIVRTRGNQLYIVIGDKLHSITEDSTIDISFYSQYLNHDAAFYCDIVEIYEDPGTSIFRVMNGDYGDEDILWQRIPQNPENVATISCYGEPDREIKNKKYEESVVYLIDKFGQDLKDLLLDRDKRNIL